MNTKPPKPQHFQRLMDTPANRIFAALVALYGDRIANDVANAIIEGEDLPTVVWPRY